MSAIQNHSFPLDVDAHTCVTFKYDTLSSIVTTLIMDYHLLF